MSVVFLFLSDLQGDWVILLKKKKKATTKKTSIPSPPKQTNTTLAIPWKPTKANSYQEITFAFPTEQSASEQQRGKLGGGGGGKTKQKATPGNNLPHTLFLKQGWKKNFYWFVPRT